MNLIHTGGTSILLWIWAVLTSLNMVEGRIHSLHIKNDQRNMVTLSTFGYYKGGSLLVNITNMHLNIMHLNSEHKGWGDDVLGFSFDRSTNKDTTHYEEEEKNSRGKCILQMKNDDLNDATQAILRIVHRDSKEEGGQFFLRIYQQSGLHFSLTPSSPSKVDVSETAEKSDFDVKLSDESTSENTTSAAPVVAANDASEPILPAAPTDEKADKTKEEENKDDGAPTDEKVDKTKEEENKDDGAPARNRRKRASDDDDYLELPIFPQDKSKSLYNIQFYVHIDTDEQEGLYQLFFHNCYFDEKNELVPITLTTHIIERNGENYLSAGEMPLPVMYMMLAILFFISALYWINILRISSSNKVFKIHYLMAVFILTKALSVTFHAIDYHFIARDGLPETWAIIFYIVYLLKGVLLILCLLLVATGWAFIKYVLNDNEKKLFMIIIPLQVIASIAYIIMEGTEEGNENYATWKNIMMLVSIVCVAAILLPVVWSIRHLHSASQTDGKAAMNLAKLRLFREFYILVILYLYFTRIIVYLLQLTLPYKLTWIYLLFAELGSLLFFVVVGYKFRPGCDNPYFQLPDYDSDDEEAQALTSNGAKETLSRVNRRQESSSDEEDELFTRQTTSKV